MHYLITGAGQIGSQLAQDLLDLGHEVTVIRRGETAPPGTTLLRGDAGDAELLGRAAEGKAAVFHCIHSAYDAAAWRRDLPSREVTVMDAAHSAGVPVIFPESVYGFGRGARDLAEGAALVPASPLGKVRKLLLDARRTHPARTVSLVAADLIGPTVAPFASVFASMVLDPVEAGWRSWVMGDPDVKRSATYIPDLTRAMIFAAEHAEKLAPDGDVVLMAPAMFPLTQREMATAAAKAKGRDRAKVSSIPGPVLGLAGLFNPMMKELHNQGYLWAEQAIIRPGILSTVHGLQATSWEEMLAEWAGVDKQPAASA